MALKQVMGNSGKKAGSMEVGESVQGYLIGLSETKFNFAIKLLTKEGTVETLFPNGNLSYIDQEIEEGNVLLNTFTKITRTGTRTSTKARDSNGEWRTVPVFSVLQDADDIVTAEDASTALTSDKAALAEAGTEGTTSKSGKFANRTRS